MNGNNGGPDNDAILSAENEGMDEAIGHPRESARAADPAAGAVNILAEQVAALEKERDELKNNMLRALAETDNVRKRANRQIEEARLSMLSRNSRATC